ncbi:hypothetical protein Angca_000970, partial [Angiostrongylus cantonensis]
EMPKCTRSYRDRQKNQFLACKTELRELNEKNKSLHLENKRLTGVFTRLDEQVNNVRKIIERN